MGRRIELNLRISCAPRLLRPWLALGVLLLAAADLGSENVTLTTYYPAPSGIYTRMITTGNAYLARDTGRVGIGTADPYGPLHVRGSGQTLNLQTSASGATTDVQFYDAGDPSGSYKWDLTYRGTASANDLQLFKNAGAGGAVMTWQYGTGRVGVGNSSPGATLDVTGTVKANTNLSIAANPPGNRPYMYVDANGSDCTTQATNNGSCSSGRYITWAYGIIINNGWWSAAPNLNFVTVATPQGNQTNVVTTAPYYYCCLP